MSETVNPAPAGNESAQPSDALDNPQNWNFDEPEKADEEVPLRGTDPESETDEAADASQETDESEPATEETETEEPEKPGTEISLPDEAVIKLPNGETVKFAELAKERMLEKDYRVKTMELGNKRRELDQTSTRVQGIVQAFSDFLAQQLPQEPQPALALKDPAEYTRQKAVYDAAYAQVNALIEMGAQAGEVKTAITSEEHQAALQEANQKLIERLPHIADPKARREFNTKTFYTAQHFGFTAEELNRTTDYRLLWMGHYAAKGLAAEQAQAKVAQKVKNAAPATTATPNKRAAPAGNSAFIQNKEAMKRLNRSGSIHDAVKIDFE